MRLALVAGLPIAASIAALAISSPALAFSTPGACNNFQTCYYANINFQPTSSILNVGREDITNWKNIPDGGHVCGGIITHTWNDCASSIKDRQTSVDMCNYANANFVRPLLITIPGETISDLGAHSFNDVISSNKFVGDPRNC